MAAAKIEELLVEKSKLEGERDDAVGQLALFKQEVCTCLYGITCTAIVTVVCCSIYHPVHDLVWPLFCSQMQTIIDEKEKTTAEALNKV